MGVRSLWSCPALKIWEEPLQIEMIVGGRNPPAFLDNLPNWCDTRWSSVGDFCPSNFMAKFWKDTFVPVSQKIKFAHYWISNGRKMRHLGSDFFLQKGLISKFPMFSLLGFPKWNPKKILFWPESSLSDELFAPVFTKWLLENGIGLNQGHINWNKIYNNKKTKKDADSLLVALS